MAEPQILDGSARPVELGEGIVIRAQGLQGTATLHEARGLGTRGVELATVEFDEALAEENVTQLQSVEIRARELPAPPSEAAIRGPAGEDALELEVPDAGGNWGQVVMLVDEAGAVTWHFPVDEINDVQPATVRGPGGRKVFRIRRHVPEAEAQDAQTRGFMGDPGKKVLKHLVYPITDPLVGAVGDAFANRWERARRPYLTRLFTPENYDKSPVPAMTGEDWERMASGPALLMIHGTFSSTHQGFGALPPEVVKELHRAYGGRVFAFDHFTLSHSPVENVREFMARVPAGLKLDVDIVCHSRGGLVARTLAEKPSFADVDTRRVNVRRIVFVGTPNGGTVLADPKYMVHMLDRITTALNLFPTFAPAQVLQAILTVVKVIGHGALKSLDGLAAQNPAQKFLADLNGVRDPSRTPEYYAIAAEFEPAPGGLRDLVIDGAGDWVFRAPNDLVVPTDTIGGGLQCPGFPVVEARLLRSPTGPTVMHTNYFSSADVHAKLHEWLR